VAAVAALVAAARPAGAAREAVAVSTLEPLDNDQPPVQVDPPAGPRTIDATVLSSRTVDKRPVVPVWMRNAGEFRALVAWLGRYGAHSAAFHSARSPLYSARLIARTPVGGWRLVRGVFRWVFDHEQAPLRADAVRRASTTEYLSLSRQRNTRVRQRGTVALTGFLLVVVGVLVFRWLAPAPIQAGVLVLVVGALGVAGTNADRRVTDRATVSALAPPRLSADSVTRALRALGISGMTAKDAELTFPAPITRDGPGWRADVDLPHGVTPAMVMEKRAELASGLRRPVGCVWPEPARDEHAGRLILWVGDQDLAKAKQPGWPLARSGRTDLFAPVPFGTDQRGRVVSVTLMFASMVVGSIPRMGKTFSVRLLLLAAALDVRAELHVYDLKGTGDFSALEPVAHAYRAGDDPDDIEYAVADLVALSGELRRRTRVIRELPRDLCPENKITPELANKRALGLHPIVLAVDECQRWFEHPDHGKALESLAEDLVRRGPAAGITAIFATQRPDAKSLPTGISGNAVLRFCLKVMGHQPNDQVLGTSAHKNGVKATIFSRRDLGIGWLAGEDDDPRITRTFYVDNPGAEVIVTRARAMREKAGRLTGHALGDEPPLTPAATLLDDLTVIFAQAEVTKLSSERVLELLAVLRPEVYGSWTPEALAAALRPDEVTPAQVWVDGANLRGYRLEQITEALQRREIEV
jgi:S-DNA-T family DNA segregation ATPase FtsK/SpoIIIE